MPKIIGSTLAEHRAATRTRLCNALATLMQERGFDAITLAEIAAEAGVGRTAVYNHFPDKESVLLAYINDETSGYLESLKQELAEVEEPLEKLRIYIRRQLQLNQVFHFAPGPSLRQVVSPKVWDDLRTHGAAMDNFLREILAGAVADRAIQVQDIEVAVRIIHSILTGRPTPTREPGRTAFIDSIEAFILRGLGTQD